MPTKHWAALLAFGLAPLFSMAQSDGYHRWPVRYDATAIQPLLCPAADFTVINSLAELPSSLRDKLKDTADRSEPYNETDVIRIPAPTQRFIIGAKSDSLILLAIDVGGFAPAKRVDTYLWKNDEWARGFGLNMERREYATLPQLLAEARRVFGCGNIATDR